VRRRIKIASLVLLIVSVVGLFASILLNWIAFDEYHAYGEVSVPGTRTLYLPAGDVKVSFHAKYAAGDDMDDPIPIPRDLEVTITPPEAAAHPVATQSVEHDCGTNTDDRDGHCSVREAHIPRAGDYKITTSGNVSPSVNPRVAFGHSSQFWFVTWLLGGLCVVSGVAFGLTVAHRGTRLAAEWPPFSFSDTEVRWNALPPAGQPDQQTDDAAELAQRWQNWAAIDSLVEEFVPEAIRRETRTRGVLREHWVLRPSQHTGDHLLIFKNGEWSLLRVNNNGYLIQVTSSADPGKEGPRETTVVDGLRESALRLLNNQ
jgi:hypothetical protein